MKTWVGLAVVGDSVTPQTIDAENLEDASRQCSEWVTSVGGQFLGVQLVDVSRATGVSKLVELGLAPEEAMAVGGFSPDYLTAQGVFPGQEWRQPITPADSYPLDWEVTWNGKTWKSTVPFNVWEPGVAAWIEVVPEGAPPPDWVQPDSSSPYMTGARVTFNGVVYTSLIDNNVWSPADYPQGWQADPA